MKKVVVFIIIFATILVFLFIKYLSPTIKNFNSSKNVCSIYGDEYNYVFDKNLGIKCCCENKDAKTCDTLCHVIEGK